jgi:FkbM family methyltransferase
MVSSSVLTAPQRLAFRNNRIFIRAIPDVAERLMYGPYIEVSEGRYSVCWRVELTGRPDRLKWGRALLRFDVTSDSGKTVLQERSVTASDINAAGGSVRIDFDIPKHGAQNVEFRVYSFGRIELLLSIIREVHDEKGNLVFSDPDLFDSISLVDMSTKQLIFVENNLAGLSTLRQRGARLCIDSHAVRASLNGIDVFISNDEDIQIFDEVFLSNTYGVELSRSFVAADIGMNVGFTTLRFAASHEVIEVHGFEPFEAPFKRAIDNFALNSALKPKIIPYKFGLYGRDMSLTVGYDPEHTIGTSIRGGLPKEKVTIELREAAPVLRPIIESARARGLTFLLKLDCEGSEFPIFASLEKPICWKKSTLS